MTLEERIQAEIAETEADLRSRNIPQSTIDAMKVEVLRLANLNAERATQRRKEKKYNAKHLGCSTEGVASGLGGGVAFKFPAAAEPKLPRWQRRKQRKA